MTQPTTGLLPWQYVFSGQRQRTHDTDRTNQNSSLGWLYGPWENKRSLLAGVPKLAGRSLGTCTSHLLRHRENLKL